MDSSTQNASINSDLGNNNGTSNDGDTGAKPHEILKFIFGVMAVILNGVLLLAMYKERAKMFITRISYLVANLAFADFLTGLTIILLLCPIRSLKFNNPGELYETLRWPLLWTTMLSSFLTLFLMSAERLVVVALPLTWSNVLTIKRTLFGIATIWVSCAIMGVLIHYRLQRTQFAITVTMEICVFVFIGVHVYILAVLRRCAQQKREPDLNTSRSGSCFSVAGSADPVPGLQGKITAVVATLLAALIITSIPYFVCLQIFLIEHVFDSGIYDHIQFPLFDDVYYYSEAFSFLNFVVNPIVYAFRLRMYRKAFRQLFRYA